MFGFHLRHFILVKLSFRFFKYRCMLSVIMSINITLLKYRHLLLHFKYMGLFLISITCIAHFIGLKMLYSPQITT
jgi:hypothetical protein